MSTGREDSLLNNSNTNKAVDIRILKTVFKKSILWLLGIFFLGLLFGFLYLRFTKPIYESKAIIQRTQKDEGQRILKFDDIDQESNLSADVELLRSPFLFEKVLKNLNLKVSYFSEGEVLTEEKFTLTPYHVTFLELKDSTLVNTPIFLNRKSEIFELSYWKLGAEKRFEVSNNSIVDNNDFKLVFKIDNKEKLNSDLKDDKLYFKINNYKLLTESLISSLMVKQLSYDAKTVSLSFKSSNQLLAQELVQELINTFIDYDQEKKSKSSENILKFIDEQLDTVYSNLKYSEDDLQTFTNSSKSNNPALFKENILSQVDELRQQMLTADIESDLITGLKEGVNLKDRASLYQLIPTLVGTRFQTLLQGQLNKLYELLEAKEDASYQVTAESQMIKNLNTNIDTQVENIAQTLNAIRNQVSSRKERLKKKLQLLESQLYGVPAKEMELAGLRRKFNLNEKYYSLLIEKRTEYEISKAGYTVDNSILQSPTTPALVSPNPRLIYVSAVFLSFLMCFIFVSIKYLTFNVVHNEDELRSLLPAKVGFLGSVPSVKMEADNSQLMVHLKPKSALAENYRHIRSNMQFILDNERSNVIAVSSSISGEGKTFVSLNLAGIYTMASKKVIILDLDLRKPKIHLGLKVENNVGMSAILSGTSNWKDCLQKSALTENLDFITAGIIPPNPSELILNGVLENLIAELRESYDIIIVDNPPVGLVSDGFNVMNNSDCPIYVVRANYTKRALMQQVNKLVLENKLRELYVIFNDLEVSVSNYGYGYSGYYSDDIDDSKKTWWKKWRS